MTVWMNILITVLVVSVGVCSPARGETIQFELILDWYPETFADHLRSVIENWVDFFVKVTSPDIDPDTRRIWISSIDGNHKCLLTAETNVHSPRWGSSGYILYLVDKDTNNDGYIDFEDEWDVRVIHHKGGVSKSIGQAKSAAWSPDGSHIGLIHDGQIVVADLKGIVQPLNKSAVSGKMVISNSRNPASAGSFWLVDAHEIKKLPDEYRTKYFWLGALSNSRTRVAFPDAMKKDIHIMDLKPNGSSYNVTKDEYLDMEPKWAPNDKDIVYVSTRPEPGPFCGNQ